ncbi:hypothetical protein BC941DRAFT_430564 [Chlamydoabsidia padenii]|nr:hypothetical protein BC941DRAFT_430564 [Chlamydoabsidia padenii]
MNYHAWLNDDSEFPPLLPDDYVLVDRDDEWQLIETATYADIVNRNHHTPPAQPAILKKTPLSRRTPHATIEEDPLYDLAYSRKSKARRRYRGDAWIHQHRVRVLTRIGYGSTIQGHDWETRYEADNPPLYMDAPVHYPSFIHCWRYVCKENPEPEVDRRRKITVQSLAILTS